MSERDEGKGWIEGEVEERGGRESEREGEEESKDEGEEEAAVFAVCDGVSISVRVLGNGNQKRISRRNDDEEDEERGERTCRAAR